MLLKGTPLEKLMPERIRRRRADLGLSGAELARRAKVSPAYVSQIEAGKRVPDVKVAVLLARVLDDDDGLFAAWSRDFKSYDRSDSSLESDGAWTRLYREGRFTDDDAFERAVRSGRNMSEARTGLEPSGPIASPSMRSISATPSSAPADRGEPVLADAARATSAPGHAQWPLVEAPIVAPGAEPGDGDDSGRGEGARMTLDPALVEGRRLERPFVFRADERVGRRVLDRVSPGDLVIVSRRIGRQAPEGDRVYAIRKGERIVLGRLARVGEKLLLLPPPGGTEMEDVGLVAGGARGRALAGEVVAVVKPG
jgi:transcriptional regulator with XRE-family HTH domain